MTTNITARSLVGMTMGARKRRWAKDYDAMPRSGRASKTVSMLRAYGYCGLRDELVALLTTDWFVGARLATEGQTQVTTATYPD